VESYVHDGLTFDVSDHGPGDGRVIVALHGFPEDRHCWDAIAATLASAGYRMLAPDQRGYSPGARPEGRRAYALDHLAGDVLALADAAGAERFDVVGHDWGAVVAWHLAGSSPGRVRSLTALSVPHSQAFLAATIRSSQLLHSWYMLFFQLPNVPEELLARGGGRRFAAQLQRSGLDEESATRYAARAAIPGAMTGPINWYRALPFDAGRRLGPIAAPTLYVWGDRDRFVTRVAAERCAQHVVGPFLFVPLAGAGHWLPSRSAAEVTPLLLDHVTGVAA
jgi:pimeloyl-ACP methyl ester carboxylesterase